MGAMSDTTKITETVVYWCDECDRYHTQEQAEEGGPLYECGNCGTTFTRTNSANDNHQCPDCNKFGSKLADVSCPDGNETEMDEQVAYEIDNVLYVQMREE
jgi:DNA-directed RNA polymerase subunit RPC12/RpoP